MPSDLQVTRLLAFHLQRAVQIHDRVIDVETESHWLRETLDHLTTGVVLLSSEYEPIYANKAAEEILLSALNPEEAAATGTRQSNPYTLLEAAISNAAVPKQPSTQLTLSITRPAGRRALGLVVRSLPRRQGTAGDVDAALAVFINDPESTTPALVGVLQSVYGLTPRETEFAGLLAKGLDLDRIAASSGITKETARSRLKSVFAKTGTHRQAELLRLVLQSSIDIRSAGN